MCIIIQSKTGALPEKDNLRLAYDNNPHGFGLMWAEDDQVEVIHGILDFEQIWQSLQYVKGNPFALHFRWVTRGELEHNQCHPFQIGSRDTHGEDIWMMHNGTFFFLNSEVRKWQGQKSDTQLFATHLGTVLQGEKSSEVLFSKHVQENMKRKIGKHNKMIFLTDDGRMEIFNESAGKHDHDFWYSNVYSFISGYRNKKN